MKEDLSGKSYYQGETAFPELRLVLHESLAVEDDEVIESVLAFTNPEINPEELENFLNVLKTKALPALKKALPGAMAGAQTGMALGPWGALAGALGGGALSALSKPKKGPFRPALKGAPILRPSPNLPLVRSPQSAGAATQLLGLLANPAILQALLSLVLGGAGRQAFNVGGIQAPQGAFGNILGLVAGQLTRAMSQEGVYREASTNEIFEGEGDSGLEQLAPLYEALQKYAALEAEYQDQEEDYEDEDEDQTVDAVWQALEDLENEGLLEEGI